MAFRTSGCPGKEADDISACDRPYGDSPPRDIASYPFRLNRNDIRKVRRQIDAGMSRDDSARRAVVRRRKAKGTNIVRSPAKPFRVI